MDGEKVVVMVRGQAWVVVTYVREGRPGEGERVSWWWSRTCVQVGGQALVVKEGGGGHGHVCVHVHRRAGVDGEKVVVTVAS